ncbi:MAG: fumarylacetoacetate hydrolase family protein [Pseudomonadales bacterium]|nr:fumarylacetoacetate hydrolase family protein [Pseudomonadales bacterium]
MHRPEPNYRIAEQATREILQAVAEGATLIGRVWLPEVSGPAPVLVQGSKIYDLSSIAVTSSMLLEVDQLVSQIARSADLPCIGRLETILKNSLHQQQDPNLPYLLAPCDLQAVKASGVTFVASMLERVIEERAAGDFTQAEFFRQELNAIIGDDLSKIEPGSEQAAQIKQVLQQKQAWSQYLEVGIGPDAEIFSKAQPMSAVGFGAQVGIHPCSNWNNPEPEIVLAVNSRGQILGASLGNDVNLRDVEGRSALLLGKAKDNNGSCAIGPFIRLFDQAFSLQDIAQADIHLNIQGDDDFQLQGISSMSKISRSPQSLVRQTIGPNHQYPDGLMLFLGTMFAPAQDRGEAGKGFTHHLGDKVSIATPLLGTLVNWVNHSDKIPQWNFGSGALMRNLAKRQLL